MITTFLFSLYICISALLLTTVNAKKPATTSQLIQKALEATFQSFEGDANGIALNNPISRDYSLLADQCYQLQGKADKYRIGCCTPNDARHLYNVLIEGKKLVVFVESSKNETEIKKHKLPPVQSVRNREKVNSLLEIEYREGKLDPLKDCTRYFNGTLHFPGRSTVHNVYHALGDNLLPLMGQIILDYYLAGDLLYAPRMILTNYQQQEGRDPLRQVSSKRTISANPNPGNRNPSLGMGPDDTNVAIHLRLMEDIMSDGLLPLGKASGMCFRRIVWGHGPHMFYTAMMQRLRRMVARFAREFAGQLVLQYQQDHPQTLWHRWNEESDLPTVQKLQLKFQEHQNKYKDRGLAPPSSEFLFNAKGESLKVLIYTRGNSGKGRTIQNEDFIVNALRQRGAEVFVCCNFANTSLEQQLYYALHADVIMGMHGAALTHGVFMAPGTITLELKTLYAYESILFPLVSDSHMGIHAQVNIKKYFIPGGQRPIDDHLVTRILRVLDRARLMQHKQGYFHMPHISSANRALAAAITKTKQARTKSKPRPMKTVPVNSEQTDIRNKHLVGTVDNAKTKVSEDDSSSAASAASISIVRERVSENITHSLVRDASVATFSTIGGQTYSEQKLICSKSALVDFVDGSTLESVIKEAGIKPKPGFTPTGDPVKGDLVFGVACSDSVYVPSVVTKSSNSKSLLAETDGLRHILGPMQETNNEECQQSIYQTWRLALDNQDEGIHCRMCDPYVL